jgi:hypothetical protein
MKSPWTAAAAVALAFVSAPTGAQSLVDTARRAEDSRKTSSAKPVTFDERDVNPLLAAREVLDYQISEDRWKKFVDADKRIMSVMENDRALYGRLEALRANSARMIERFLMREPSLLKVLQACGTEAHEYAYTSVAIGVAMALIASDPGPQALEQMPEATRTNLEFVRLREKEVKELLERGQQLQEKMLQRGR